MSAWKRICIPILCFALLTGCSGKACAKEQSKAGSVPTETPTSFAVPEQSETPAPTFAAAYATPTPTASPEPSLTPAPTPEDTPVPQAEAENAGDEAFLALDRELFVWFVSGDILTLDAYCADPASFGIDVSTVPVTLGDWSEAAEDEWVADCISWRERLNGVERETLSETNAFAYDMYLRYFDRQIEGREQFYCNEPLNMINGTHLNLPFDFALYHFRNVQDIENYIALMNDVPRYFDQILAFEQVRAERGLFMTEQMLDTILSDLQKVADSAETSFLHGTFREEIEKADFLTEAEREAYIAQNDLLVETVWVNSYQTLHDGLELLRPMCRERIGAYEQGGDAYAYYCSMLKSAAAGNRTVEEEIALLERSMDLLWTEFMFRAMSCYDELMSDTEITNGSIEADVEYLKSLMPEIVPPMPEVEVDYREVPKELQDSYSPASYFRPSFDRYTHNTIMINPADTCDLFTMAHEGYPGHMYQFTYHHALGTVPFFLILTESKGYSESWSTNMELNVARVNERFGADYSTVLVLDKRMTTLLAMICSLKVNGQGATEEDLEEYLDQWMVSGMANRLYDRAIDMPTYYFKYAGGFAELMTLTYDIRKQTDVDLVTFYTEFLRWGPGDYDLLRERMEAWANAE